MARCHALSPQSCALSNPPPLSSSLRRLLPRNPRGARRERARTHTRTRAQRARAAGARLTLTHGSPSPTNHTLTRFAVNQGIRRLELEERWSWAPAQAYDSTRYLDASCLIFGPGRVFVEAVDYQSKRNTAASGAPGAVRHSGDLLRSVLCEGTHTIAVDLDALDPARVSELFITLSAWAGARLGEIRRPSVRLSNPEGTEGGGPAGGPPAAACLCEYRLEDVPKAALDRYSSVVMCRVYRRGADGSTPTGGVGAGTASAANPTTVPGGGWEVEAVGHLGHGHADAYAPMIHTIQHELGVVDALSAWKM